jgi:TPP-dependent pyruvate/acetoin dehydrogenase alpha subunit
MLDRSLQATISEIEAEVKEAFDYADKSPFPLAEQAYVGVYA